MKHIRIFYVLLIVLQIQIYSQENVVEVNANPYPYLLVDANLINYNSFTLVINKVEKLNETNFSIEYEGKYFDWKLKEKSKNRLVYEVKCIYKNTRKRSIKLLLKVNGKTEHFTTISFFKNIVDIDEIKKDSIVELGFSNHPPRYISHYAGRTDYTIMREANQKIVTWMPLLQTSSIKLNKLWVGDYRLIANNDTLFKIRITPPLTLAKESEKTSKILSKAIKPTDSLTVAITYADRVDRIQWYAGGEINITICDNQFSFTHETKNPKRLSHSFQGKDKGIVNALLNFETKGKATAQCSSISEDASFVGLTINGQKTRFEFCTKEWDGLQEFIDHITAMKTNDEKK